ncbi:MAG: aldehyde dehydrogenase EutE, partial [Planctomycetaceae bacterium]|nr:aldehyde dehydrogenase EutE [Planctomycetaceae bacterium]
MQVNESMIRNVVAQVLAEVGPAPVVSGASQAGRYGVFDCAHEAVTAARQAFEQLSERTIDDRRRIIDHIRRISIEQSVELGTMEMNETKIGRLDHKINKLETL